MSEHHPPLGIKTSVCLCCSH